MTGLNSKRLTFYFYFPNKKEAPGGIGLSYGMFKKYKNVSATAAWEKGSTGCHQGGLALQGSHWLRIDAYR